MRLAILVVVGLFLLPSFAFAAPLKGYCILWLRTDLGIEVRGNAWDIRGNVPINEMTEGDVLLTREGPGHGAAIVGFKGSIQMGDHIAPEYIIVIENWEGRVRTRDIRWGDERIRAVYRPVDKGFSE